MSGKLFYITGMVELSLYERWIYEYSCAQKQVFFYIGSVFSVMRRFGLFIPNA